MQWTRQKVGLLIFAWLGVTNSFIIRMYPAGFMLVFLQDNKLSSLAGTVAVSTLYLTGLIAPFFNNQLTKRGYGLQARCVILGIGCSVSMLMMGVVDGVMMGVKKEQDTQHRTWETSLYLTIGLIRAIQGALAGEITVLYQGEFVDKFFKGIQPAVVIISSGCFFGTPAGIFIGATVYSVGSWWLVAVVLSAVMALPLLVLPALKLDQEPEYEAMPDGDGKGNTADVPTKRMSFKQHAQMRFFELTTLFCNHLYATMMYTLPDRLVKFNGWSVSLASTLTTALCVPQFGGTLAIAYLLKVRPLPLVYNALGTVLFISGVLLLFCYTTSSYSMGLGPALLGLVLCGLGDPAYYSLFIPSVFAFYKRWNRDITGLATRASTTLVWILNISSVTGVVFSSVCISESLELETVGYIASNLILPIGLGIIAAFS